MVDRNNSRIKKKKEKKPYTRGSEREREAKFPKE